MLLDINLIELSFTYTNIIPTTLMALVMTYWIFVILGGLTTEFLDFDVDVEMDVDIDHDVHVDSDVDHSGHSESGVVWLNKVLVFFNLGRIPFMVFLTALALPLWISSVYINALLGNSSFLISLLLMIPLLIGSLFISKVLTMPMIRLFDKLNDEGPERDDLIGKICSIRLKANDQLEGQGEINLDGSSILINVKTAPGMSLAKGEDALVIQYLEKEQVFLVEPYSH